MSFLELNARRLSVTFNLFVKKKKKKKIIHTTFDFNKNFRKTQREKEWRLFWTDMPSNQKCLNVFQRIKKDTEETHLYKNARLKVFSLGHFQEKRAAFK